MMNLTVARAALCAACGVALLFLTYAIASAPTRVASRLGMRGLKRRRALENSPVWSSIEPSIRWLGFRVSGLLSRDVAQRLDTQIRLAGDYLGLTPEEYVGLSIVSAAGGGVLGLLVGASTGKPALLAIACFALGGALPYLQISEQAQRRLKDIDRGLPHAIDLIALGMSAGLDFPGAVRQVVERSSRPDDPIVEELTRLLQELQLGRTRRQVLEELGKRAPTQSVTELVSALVQAEDKGNPVADVIQTQAAVSRARRTVRAEEQASKASVMMVGPLFLLFACIMLLVLGPMVLTLASQDL